MIYLSHQRALSLVAAEVVGHEQQRLLQRDALHGAEVGARQRALAQLVQAPEHGQQQQRVLEVTIIILRPILLILYVI